MISRTHSDGELESIVRLVTALADESVHTAPVAQQLATCALVLDENLGDDPDDVVRFTATALGLDGNGIVTDGSLGHAALFVTASGPTVTSDSS